MPSVPSLPLWPWPCVAKEPLSRKLHSMVSDGQSVYGSLSEFILGPCLVSTFILGLGLGSEIILGCALGSELVLDFF